jgi:hypothetical protein
MVAAEGVGAQDVTTNRLDVLKAQSRSLFRSIDEQAERQRAGILIAQRNPAGGTGTVSAAGSAMLETVEVENAQRKARLLREYVVALDALVRQLVQQDNLTEARRVRSEKENTAFLLAELEAEIPAPTPAPVHGAPSPAPVSTVKAAPVPVFRERIPDGAVEYKGHHYLLFQHPTSWIEAKSACTRKGGHLVILGDAAEDSFVGRLASCATNGPDAFWIGLTCERWERRHLDRKLPIEHGPRGIRHIRRDEGSFRWVDNTELTLSDHGADLTVRLTYRETQGPTTALRSRQEKTSRFGDYVAVPGAARAHSPPRERPTWILGTDSDRYGSVCEWDY